MTEELEEEKTKEKIKELEEEKTKEKIKELEEEKKKLLFSLASSKNEMQNLSLIFSQEIDFKMKKIFTEVINFFFDLDERALKNMKETNVDHIHIEALEMMKKKLWNFLESEGVKIVEIKKGDLFDSNFHESLEIIEDFDDPKNPLLKPDENEKIFIEEKISNGYLFKNNIVILSAKVKVKKVIKKTENNKKKY